MCFAMASAVAYVACSPARASHPSLAATTAEVQSELKQLLKTVKKTMGSCQDSFAAMRQAMQNLVQHAMPAQEHAETNPWRTQHPQLDRQAPQDQQEQVRGPLTCHQR